MRRTVSCTAALAFALVPLAVNAQQQVAGQVIWMAGQVSVINPDKIARSLAKGDSVRQGETIVTGPGSHAQLLMSDQGLIAVRPDSSLRLAAYRYQSDQGKNSAMLELVKGGMRSVTGAIGQSNKEDYKLKTDTASVGIRGTDHEVLAVGQGTYSRVTQGGTYLQGAEGSIDLAPGEIGFAGKSGKPTRLQSTPAAMQLAALQGAGKGQQMRGSGPGDELRLLVPFGAPFNGGVIAHGKRTLPEQVTMPVLPAQALGENRGASAGKGRGKP